MAPPASVGRVAFPGRPGCATAAPRWCSPERLTQPGQEIRPTSAPAEAMVMAAGPERKGRAPALGMGEGRGTGPGSQDPGAAGLNEQDMAALPACGPLRSGSGRDGRAVSWAASSGRVDDPSPRHTRFRIERSDAQAAGAVGGGGGRGSRKHALGTVWKSVDDRWGTWDLLEVDGNPCRVGGGGFAEWSMSGVVPTTWPAVRDRARNGGRRGRRVRVAWPRSPASSPRRGSPDRWHGSLA